MKKMTIHYLIFTLSFMVFTTSLAGQKRRLDKANTAFENYNYDIAIPLYLKILDKADIAKAKINLAESYRKTNNGGEAEFWYGQIVHLPEAKSIWYLYYAKALYANGKCDLAQSWFEKYEATSEYSREKLLFSYEDCEEFDGRFKPPRNNFYEIRKLPFNTKHDDFSPIFCKEGLIFVSEQPSNISNSPSLSSLYLTIIDTIDNDARAYTYNEKIEKHSKKPQSGDESFCFNKEETKVFFTRNTWSVKENESGEQRLKIFIADIKEDKWVNIQEYPFNSDEYSVAHPTISEDSKTMYFTSDMLGGFGGMDLYYTVLEDGQWSPPRNLGPRINTENDEVFPSIHTSGRLYFASDGHKGLGGFDIYYCENNDGIFGKITNLGFPINAITDDYGIILNEDKTFGYFTSNREGGEGGDDIYSFKYQAITTEILVYDEQTGEPIEGATVVDDCSGLELITNKNGRITIEMPLNKCCSFTTNKENYAKNIVESCTHDYKNGTKTVVKIPLKIKPLSFVIEGQVYKEKTDKPLENATVILTSDCLDKPIEFKTDENGRYHFVVDKDCCYTLKAKYKKDYFVISKEKPYCTKELTKSDTLKYDFYLHSYIELEPNGKIKIVKNDTCNGIGHSFVIQHVYYNFENDTCNNSKKPLIQLIQLLEDNPDLIIEIGTHVDARGSNRYSTRVSKKNPVFVMKYLIRQGIDEKRLEVEDCNQTELIDKAPCEEEHQRNRYTRFRVVGKVDGTRYDCETVDTATNKNPELLIPTDRCKNCPF